MVPPSAATTSDPVPNETKVISANEISVVKMIATHGVRRNGCTSASGLGSTPWLAMP